MARNVRVTEATAAGAITVFAVALHLIHARSAGPLWRDEANTIGLATLPSLSDVWANLQFDSFPFLWPLIVRFYAELFGQMNDHAFRVIGALTGIAIIGALWFNARVFRYGFPFVALSLFALSPSVIRWGDSMRAYGTGILAILITAPLLFRFVEAPSIRRFAIAGLAAVASVHLLYYNSVLLFAFACGAITICLLHRDWIKALLVVLIGVSAGISLLPYGAVISAAAEWNPLVQIPHYTFGWFMQKLQEALEPAGPWALWLWLEIIVVAVWAGVRGLMFSSRRHSDADRDKVAFALASLAVGSVGSFLFLRKLSYVTQPWYYLTLLALVAVCLDIILGTLFRSQRARIVLGAGAVLVAVLTAASAADDLHLPNTNVTAVTHVLEKESVAEDVVVITPWHLGVSFSRYYAGRAPWMTIPGTNFHRFHRYDRIKTAMEQPDQTEPVRAAISTAGNTLASGGRVFVVGQPTFPPATSVLRKLHPAPTPDGFWPEPAYQDQWSKMFGMYIRRHALMLVRIHPELSEGISGYEDMVVFRAEGWRP